MQASRFANFYVDIHFYGIHPLLMIAMWGFVRWSNSFFYCHFFSTPLRFLFFFAALLLFLCLLLLALRSSKVSFLCSIPFSSLSFRVLVCRVVGECENWKLRLVCLYTMAKRKWWIVVWSGSGGGVGRLEKKTNKNSRCFNWLKSSSAKSDTTISESSRSISYRLKFFQTTKWATVMRKWHFKSPPIPEMSWKKKEWKLEREKKNTTFLTHFNFFLLFSCFKRPT